MFFGGLLGKDSQRSEKSKSQAAARACMNKVSELITGNVARSRNAGKQSEWADRRDISKV